MSQDKSSSSSAGSKPKKTSRKPANAAGRKRSAKSTKRSVRKATAKRKPVTKRTAPLKRVAAKRGRPMAYPDKTVVRMPKGWLRELNAMVKSAGTGQGVYLRKAVARAMGKPLTGLD